MASRAGAGPREVVRLLRVALALLTRVPVGAVHVGDGDLHRASAAFPLVGLVVGGVVVGVWAAGEPLLGPAPATVLAVLAAVLVTGAFHEDGLADTVDGLWGGHDPARRVEIMRDSRLGTYGTVALLGSLLLQVVLLTGLDVADVARVAVTGHVLGRGGILLLARWLPPVAPDGSGAQVAGPAGPVGASVAAVTCVATAVVALGWAAALPLAVVVLVAWGVRHLVQRRLGGLVGDVLGAAQQAAMLATMVTVLALLEAGWA